MPTPKPTPEEKLFAVIQGAQQAPVRGRSRPLSLAAVGARLVSVIGPLDLPRMNRVLTAMLIGMGVLCVISPIMMQPKMNRVIAQADARVRPFTIAAPLDGLKGTEAYVQLVRDQDPFHVGRHEPAPAVTTPPPPPPPSPGPSPQELVRDFKLVGISWGPEPVAMIEDTKTTQTYVLKAGGTVGSATVKEILQHRVILRINDQDVELF